MHEQLQKLENLPKSSDPPITIAQIFAEAKLLLTICDPIVNIYKPKPKVAPHIDETKQDGDKKEDEKNGENTGQHPAQRKTRQQVNHDRLATTLAQKIPRTLAPMISTWMLPVQPLVNDGKLNYI